MAGRYAVLYFSVLWLTPFPSLLSAVVGLPGVISPVTNTLIICRFATIYCVLALILTSCGLAAINADDIWYFASGGVIGSLLSTTLQPLLHSSGGTIALLCVWAAGLTLFTGWSWVTIAEKLGGLILNILTFASNRTRRDDTWVDEDEYEDDEEYEDENHGKQHESRRARILRGALARRKRLAEKFINPMGRQTDAALFSGKRMDDDEEITYTARGVAADRDDRPYLRAIVQLSQNMTNTIHY